MIWALHLVKEQCDAGCTLADSLPVPAETRMIAFREVNGPDRRFKVANGGQYGKTAFDPHSGHCAP